MQKNKKEEHKNPLITYTHDMHINKVMVFFFSKIYALGSKYVIFDIIG